MAALVRRQTTLYLVGFASWGSTGGKDAIDDDCVLVIL